MLVLLRLVLQRVWRSVKLDILGFWVWDWIGMGFNWDKAQA